MAAARDKCNHSWRTFSECLANDGQWLLCYMDGQQVCEMCSQCFGGQWNRKNTAGPASGSAEP